MDGAFCLPHLLYGRRNDTNASKFGQLMKSPLSDWSSAKAKFQAHEDKSNDHKSALLTMQTEPRKAEETTIKTQEYLHLHFELLLHFL